MRKFLYIKGGISLMQGKALFNTKKRLSPIEKGVSLILLKASLIPSEGGDVFRPKPFFDSKFNGHNPKVRLLLLLKSINKFFARAFLTRNTRMAQSLKGTQSS